MINVAEVRRLFEALMSGGDDGVYRSSTQRESEWHRFAVGYYMGLVASGGCPSAVELEAHVDELSEAARACCTAVGEFRGRLEERERAFDHLCTRVDKLEGLAGVVFKGSPEKEAADGQSTGL